jgi:hypothetical protein
VVLEVANVLRKRMRREELHAEDAIADLSAAPIQFHGIGSLVTQSLALAHGFTAYDATYVALATRVGGIVITNDGSMRQRAFESGLAIVTPSESPETSAGPAPAHSLHIAEATSATWLARRQVLSIAGVPPATPPFASRAVSSAGIGRTRPHRRFSKSPDFPLTFFLSGVRCSLEGH